MRQLFWLGGLAVLVFGFLQWRAQGRPAWTRIAPGLEMRTLHVSTAHTVRVIALRTSPARVHIATGDHLAADGWRQRESALVAVNGGFFDADGHSLGLRVAHGRRVNRAHHTKWGVFLVRSGAAQIVPTSEFHMQPQIREAVQCGPRLVINGRTTTLKPQWASRTGIGIQRDGRVILACSAGELSFQEWADLWAARDGLNCRDALNLDGGSSTQLSLKTRTTSLQILGGRLVPDAVVVR